MKLIVMIPAFNEEETIGEVIKKVPREISGIEDVEVLVINDGSTDDTVKTASKSGADHVVSHRGNRGVGLAFQTGIDKALSLKADMIVNIDADGQFNPLDIPKLVEPILEGEADFVTATRFMDKTLEPRMPWIKKYGNKVFTKLINLLTNGNFTDTQCGFRAFSREAALRLMLFGKFTYTQEVFIDLVNKDFRIKEVPLKVEYMDNRESRVVGNPWGYGLKAMIIIVRTIRDYKPLRFFGSIGVVTFLAGAIIALSLGVRLILTHRIYPYMSIVYIALVFIILGFLLVILALIADMMDRQRKIQEDVRYMLKKNGE